MKRSSGLTLTELVATLGIAAILASLAAPAFSAMLKDNRLTVALNDFVAALNLARSEAIKRGARVTLCKSAPPHEECAGDGGWEQGWIAFEDPNDSGARDSGEDIIRVHDPLEPGLDLSGNTPVAGYISYVNTGVTRLTGGGFQAGTLRLCDDRGKGRSIAINSLGRPRVSEDASGCAN